MALRRDAVAGGRRHPQRRQHRRRRSTPRPAHGAEHAARHGRRPIRVVYLDLQNSKYRRPVQHRQGRDGDHRSVGPVELPRRRLRRPVLPSYDGSNHETIAGPDMWVCSTTARSARRRRGSSSQWLTAAEQVQKDAMPTGHLPDPGSRCSTRPGFIEDFGKKFPGQRRVRREPRQREAGAARARQLPADLRGDGPGDRGRAAGREGPADRRSTRPPRR